MPRSLRRKNAACSHVGLARQALSKAEVASLVTGRVIAQVPVHDNLRGSKATQMSKRLASQERPVNFCEDITLASCVNM